MKQMVLPQTPAPGMQNDAGAPKSEPAASDTTGENRYESVSRAEQKRLDRKQSEPAENRPQAADKKQTEAKKPQAGVASKEVSEEAVEMEATASPLTFAELQALLPASGRPGVMGDTAGLFQAGLSGGKPGQPVSGEGAGLIAGLQLPEGLFSAAGEKAGALDTASLLTGNTRFESAVELVTQQSNTLAGRLGTEAQVPLRSYATSVDVPVNHAEWGDKLMGKLSWLTAKNLSEAEIHLTPPDMGPMEVRVRVQNDQAAITVHAANPVVREQLELHSHRLRDMLDEQGFSLAGFDVSDNPGGESREQEAHEGQEAPRGRGGVVSAVEDGGEEAQSGSLDLSWKGVVDIFA
ncbi:flagellar hook-length control protein FliK [Marinobacter piscensis]|uniref:flagellar hook-length control protein FliK n=1 Tax=Marinobacter piscensis TaxID=1562308 RepID=UPI0011A8CB20|nr:flagellar hook-length control protein FliK [Marinobacter piscensis]